MRRHVLEPRMVNKMFGRIIRKRNVPSVDTVDAIIETEYNAQAGLGKDRVRRPQKDAVVGDIFACICEPILRKVFLDGEMRELHHLRITIIDDGDQT